ncbi:hypothetical protein UPYG_G00013860 [Umbra pygmaea]|uniref:Uncharacterized protein n=1 Tax=Umbra pygmaea TaxID=75934 RepID=A0ABD0XJ65_UMBPY
MCSNKIIVPVEDKDEIPYSCPCTVSLEADDKLKTLWKLDPATGMNATLVSLRSLPYGNYTIPLVIQDQQSQVGYDTIEVLVCDCDEVDKCRSLMQGTSTLGWAAIVLLLAGLLVLSLLLFLLKCNCGSQKITNLSGNLQDEGNQTLIQYNEEGGGSDCKNEPVFNIPPSSPNAVTMDVTDGMKQICQAIPVTWRSSTARGRFSRAGTFQRKGEANGNLRSQIQRDRYQSWSESRNCTMRSHSSKYSRSFSLMSDQHISEQINRGLHRISDDVDYQPCMYADEGTGSKCQSLDELSLQDVGDDLNFLDDLGSKFKTLGGICHQDMQERGIKL